MQPKSHWQTYYKSGKQADLDAAFEADRNERVTLIQDQADAQNKIASLDTQITSLKRQDVAAYRAALSEPEVVDLFRAQAWLGNSKARDMFFDGGKFQNVPSGWPPAVDAATHVAGKINSMATAYETKVFAKSEPSDEDVREASASVQRLQELLSA